MTEEKPDILAVMEREGLKLRRAGQSYRGKCPNHNGKSNGSLAVYPDSQSWYCFGCSEGGDAIDFIMKLKGLSFKDACVYLGIKPGKKPLPNPAQERRKSLFKAYAAWKKERYLDLCDQAIEIHALRIKANSKAPLPKHLAWFMAEQLAKLPKIENDLNVYLSKDDEQIFEILQMESNA